MNERLPEEFNLRGQSPLHRPPHTQCEEAGIPSNGQVLVGEPRPKQDLSQQGKLVLLPSRCDCNWPWLVGQGSLISQTAASLPPERKVRNVPGQCLMPKWQMTRWERDIPSGWEAQAKNNTMSFSMGSTEHAPLWPTVTGPLGKGAGTHKQYLEGAIWQNGSYTWETWWSLMYCPPASLVCFSINWLVLYFLGALIYNGLDVLQQVGGRGLLHLESSFAWTICTLCWQRHWFAYCHLLN